MVLVPPLCGRLGGDTTGQMVRPGNWNQPAGVSPARVGTGAPGSRPQLVGETWRAERGVKSLLGGSKSVGRSDVRVLQPRRASWTSCGGLAGGSPVGVMTKQPRSWWPVEGETRLSKRHDEVVLDGERVIGPYDQESCRVLMQALGDGGPSGSRALGEKAKATDGAKTLEVQHPRTHGRMGSRTITQPTMEQERSVSALASMTAVGRPAVPSNSEAYKQRCEVVERRAEVGGGHMVVVMVRTTQPHRSEGPPAGCAFGIGLAAGLPFGATHPLPSGDRPDRPRNAWASVQRRWHGGMVLVDCSGASRVRENRMHGSGGGCWRRTHAYAWAPRQRPTSQMYNGGAEPLISRRRPRPAGPVPGVTSAGSLRGMGSGTRSRLVPGQERPVCAAVVRQRPFV